MTSISLTVAARQRSASFVGEMFALKMKIVTNLAVSVRHSLNRTKMTRLEKPKKRKRDRKRLRFNRKLKELK
jgi:hypothetical protein